MEGFELSSLLTDLPLNLLNILLLYLIISRLVYRPVKKFLTQRTQRVNDAAQAAAQQAQEAQETKQRYENLLADSQKAARQQLALAETEATRRADEIVADANRKAAVLLADAKTRADATHEAALAGLQDEVAALAVDITEKLLSRELTDADNKKIAEEFFSAQAMKPEDPEA